MDTNDSKSQSKTKAFIQNCIANGIDPTVHLPNKGLRHTPEHLRKMNGHMGSLTLEQQAEYADVVCVTMIKDPAYAKIREKIMDFVPTTRLITFLFSSATTVGNYSYMALHAPEQKQRDKYTELIKLYKVYEEKKHSKSAARKARRNRK